MAKAFIACFRARSVRSELAPDAFRKMARRLAEQRPGPGRLREPLVASPDDSLVAACFSPSPAVGTAGGSIRLGAMSGTGGDWAEPSAPVGDGTFALFRSSVSEVELVTDAMATRAIWYYHDDERFVAASSQRLIVMWLGTFCASPAPISWMLANGVTGPEGGWDRRIRLMPSETRLVLNRTSWTLRAEPVAPLRLGDIDVDDAPKAVFAQRLRRVLAALDIDWVNWRLPLSGGFDSRLLACLIAPLHKICSMTWDLAVNRSAPNPEMEVAVKLAEALGLAHERIDVPPAVEGAEAILDRFVQASEGLSDSVGGYLDGFRLWGRLAEAGVEGIVRGDEPFGGRGWLPVYNERDVRVGLGLAMLGDHPSTKWLVGAGIADRALPAAFERQLGEGLSDWRHRLYLQYRGPVALAALTETKSGYLEVVNPLQARSVVAMVKALPDTERDDKALLVRTVQDLGPDVPFASVREGDEQVRFLRSSEVTATLRRGLDSDAARAILSPGVVAGLLDRLPASASAEGGSGCGMRMRMRNLRQALADRVRAEVPRFVKRRLKRVVPTAPIDPSALAFRAWIIVRIHQVLAQDARCLAEDAER